MVTKSVSHIDVIMGFSTGEIIWWEPISQRYTRLNKNVRMIACQLARNSTDIKLGNNQQHARIRNPMDSWLRKPVLGSPYGWPAGGV